MFYALRNMQTVDFRLHQAINYAETLPLKVKDPNEVNEDLSVLLTTTMSHKTNENLAVHICCASCALLFSGNGAVESAIQLYRERNKQTRARAKIASVVARARCAKPPRASPRAYD